ncbi:flavodoxin family protein [Streptantibioticus silvisoli]|uniref:NAD(P)H-dependent oxidoreductase n=1 Tax=Streptantibioticus silvisoli TaxID=2705255 RepID=A0ABT6W3X8_9ACTN|nr:NAD(P)H-dependent oxidoreductase [Streptantibioticus silvisoli]MDI5965431.1 NAD(P)H-dependent oxidoreductase [Streptantibioticus silvisoli]
MPPPTHSVPPGPGARFLFVLGGGRPGGSTEALARRAADGLPDRAARRWLRLADHPLPAFEDARGTPAGTAGAGDRHERVLLEATLEATDLVIVSPLYWYTVSAATKLYLDHWSRWMDRADLAYRERMRGKTMWAVSSCASPDPADADPLAGMLRRTARHLDMEWGGLLLGRGPGRPDRSAVTGLPAGPRDRPPAARPGEPATCDSTGRPVEARAFFTAGVLAAAAQR